MKILMKGMIMAILLAGLMGFTAQATILPAVLATQDTTLKPYKPNNNYNSLGWGLHIENSSAANHIYTAVVGGFTLPDLGGESLVSATLRLQNSNHSADLDLNPGVTLGVYRLGSAWDETTATWDTPSSAWASPGVAGTASTPTDVQVDTLVAGDWVEWNVTADIADMYANGNNFGWAVQGEIADDGYIYLQRHENGDTVTGQLVIETAPIPEPGSLFLLGTGLLSLVSLVRRKRS